MIVLAYNLADMTSVDDDGEDIEHEVITEILKICTDGCTEQNRMEQTAINDQLKRIMAEIELLHYIEARRITTDQGYIFLEKGIE
jgi:hypothetical protein